MERTIPIPAERDAASRAAEWASGVATLLGGAVTLGCAMALAAAASGGAGEPVLWLNGGLLGGVMQLGGAWRLRSYGTHRRAGAVFPVLLLQAGLLPIAALLLWLLHGGDALLRRGPEAPAVVLVALLLGGPSLLNLRALVLCGGPHWRRAAPDWLELLTSAGKLVFGGTLLLAVAMGLALPRLITCGPRRNSEAATIGILRALSTAQEQFRNCAMVDPDGDGIGEYGTLGELAGTIPLRGSGNRCNASPFIAPILGVLDSNGFAHKSGYFFAHTLLPPTPADPEPGWCCYAWPNSRGQSGNRAFYIDHRGVVMACANNTEQWSGSDRAPSAGAPDRETWVPAGN